jgi:hypothetical protein
LVGVDFVCLNTVQTIPAVRVQLSNSWDAKIRESIAKETAGRNAGLPATAQHRSEDAAISGATVGREETTANNASITVSVGGASGSGGGNASICGRG